MNFIFKTKYHNWTELTSQSIETVLKSYNNHEANYNFKAINEIYVIGKAYAASQNFIRLLNVVNQAKNFELYYNGVISHHNIIRLLKLEKIEDHVSWEMIIESGAFKDDSKVKDILEDHNGFENEFKFGKHNHNLTELNYWKIENTVKKELFEDLVVINNQEIYFPLSIKGEHKSLEWN